MSNTMCHLHTCIVLSILWFNSHLQITYINDCIVTDECRPRYRHSYTSNVAINNLQRNSTCFKSFIQILENTIAEYCLYLRKSCLVGWDINVPFQHKNRLYQGQSLGWRFRFARLRTANDTADLLVMSVVYMMIYCLYCLTAISAFSKCIFGIC